MNTLLTLLLTTSTFAAPNGSFSVDLYKELAKKPGNVFFSPYSVQSALAMTSAGAKGKTLEEMNQALHLGKNAHAEMNELRKALASDGDGKPVLTIANQLWAQTGAPYKKDFLSLTKNFYEAEATQLNFQANPESARKTINTWVEDKTQHKIVNLLQEGTITPDTDLVLTNAIYFKSDWEDTFEKDATRDQEFKPDTGKAFSKEFMHRSSGYDFAEDENFSVIRMPYKGGQQAMTIYLPKEGKKLSAVEGKFNAKLVEKFRSSLKREDVILSLPKFRLEQSEALEKILPNLGMKLAFQKRAADFSGMRELKADEFLYISAVVHKAFVEVDEKGTEAAAATAVVMMVGSAAPAPRAWKTFTADHPFIFTIEHVPTGTALFMGRVAKP